MGPRSPEEAAFLWSEGKALATKGDCTGAVGPLKRFVDRYPGLENYVVAHLLLGRCQFVLGETTAAIKALRYFVGGSGARAYPEYFEGKVLLTRALIKIRDFPEALLAATELERETRDRPALTARRVEGLLLKAEALSGRGEGSRAQAALTSAQSNLKGGALPDSAAAPLRAELALVSLELNARECAALPSRDQMDEAQARSQYDRRASCQLKGLTYFREVLAQNQESWSARAVNELLESFHDYSQACGSPPEPKPLREGKPRTAEQLRKYKDELAALLKSECAAHRREALDLLATWKAQAPPTTAGMIEKVRAGL